MNSCQKFGAFVQWRSLQLFGVGWWVDPGVPVLFKWAQHSRLWRQRVWWGICAMRLFCGDHLNDSFSWLKTCNKERRKKDRKNIHHSCVWFIFSYDENRKVMLHNISHIRRCLIAFWTVRAHYHRFAGWKRFAKHLAKYSPSLAPNTQPDSSNYPCPEVMTCM